AAMPEALIFGSDGLAESTYTEPARGGIPTSLDARVLLTAAAPAPVPESAAHAFYSAYGRSYGDPEPDAVYGYEAMSLLLNAISRATHGGHRPARRSQVLAAI